MTSGLARVERARDKSAPPEAPVPSGRARQEPALDEAMDRYARGDASAFAALHRALAPRLRGFLLRLGCGPSQVDDLVQETMLRMHRARATFAPGAATVPWAYAIARNAFVDARRAARNRPAEALGTGRDSDPVPEPPAGAATDVESAAIAAEAARVVERTLSGLPRTQREAFVLLRYEGMSVADAAEVLGATQTAVKLRAFRAYEALREALAGAQGGGR